MRSLLFISTNTSFYQLNVFSYRVASAQQISFTIAKRPIQYPSYTLLQHSIIRNWNIKNSNINNSKHTIKSLVGLYIFMIIYQRIQDVVLVAELITLVSFLGRFQDRVPQAPAKRFFLKISPTVATLWTKTIWFD